jgi:hypothetical protein
MLRKVALSGPEASYSKLTLSKLWLTALAAIILLDPPFDVDDADRTIYGTRMESVYRSFVSRPLPFKVKEKDIDSRESYTDSLIHYLRHSDVLKGRIHPQPLLIIQGLARIIASEWIVNTYIERDLNNIEWTLEMENVTLEVFEGFIKRLFILRRRIGKYRTLLDDQHAMFLHQMPAFGDTTGDNTVEGQVFAGMKDDLVQVQRAIDRNTDRISQTLELITSIMSVRKGETSMTRNQTLGFLTILATVALPFNTITTIVGLQTDYAIRHHKWWAYFGASSIAAGFIAVLHIIFRICVWLRGHRVGLN